MARAAGSPSAHPLLPRSILLLGAGELGKEIAISAQRLGLRVIAADRSAQAPAMQVADASEVLSLRDGTALQGVIRSYRPDLILPEVEAIQADTLAGLEEQGFHVVPSAATAELVMDRSALRALVRDELGLRTPVYRFASSVEELREACDDVGYPCVVKPVAAYPGKGQSVVPGPARVDRAWAFAYEEAMGDAFGVVVEEFVEFRSEVTLLTIRELDGTTTHLPPIGQRQERGGHRESWIPADLEEGRSREMREQAGQVAARLGGAGVFGVEFSLRMRSRSSPRSRRPPRHGHGDDGLARPFAVRSASSGRNGPSHPDDPVSGAGRLRGDSGRPGRPRHGLPGPRSRPPGRERPGEDIREARRLPTSAHGHRPGDGEDGGGKSHPGARSGLAHLR